MPRVNDAYLKSKRTEIIDAAMTCFARQGFHRTTMQDIVRETGSSAGAIYRYFRSKEDIVAAIAQERHAPEGAVLDGAADQSDVTVTLRELVHSSLGRLSDPDEQRWRRITVQVWAEALRDERIMQIVREGLDGPIDVLTELIESAQKDGTFPPEMDAVGAARICASLFYGLVLQQAWDPEVDVDGYIEAVLIVLDGLAGPRRKRTSRARAT